MWGGFSVDKVYQAATRIRKDVPADFRTVCEIVEEYCGALSDRTRRAILDEDRHAISNRAGDPRFDGAFYLWAAAALHALADVLLAMSTGSEKKIPPSPALTQSVSQVEAAPPDALSRLRTLLLARPWQTANR